MSLNVKKYMYV